MVSMESCLAGVIAAGVNNDYIGKACIGHDLKTVRSKLAEHIFRINGILGTAKGYRADL